MNENPQNSNTDSEPLTPPHTDRSTRLLIFGILGILGSLFCLAMVPLMFLAIQIAPEEVHMGTVGPAIAFYGVIGILGMIVSIGSIRCRRWARDLILAGASLALALGIPACIFSCFIVGKTMGTSMEQSGAQVSESMVQVITVITGIFYALLFILLPLTLVLCYRGRDVLATCIARSRATGFTSHLSIPQLVCILICLMMFLNTIFLPVFMPVVMVWDQVLTGTPAILMLILFAAASGYATWGLYYQVPAAWWVGLLSITIIGLNFAISFAVGDIMDFYRELNMPAKQLQVIEDSGIADIMAYTWISIVIYLAIVAAFFWHARPAKQEQS